MKSVSAVPDTPAQVAALARELYVRGPAVARAMQHYRPYISPFELLIKAVPPGSRVLDIGCGSGLFLGLLCGTGRIQSGFGFDEASIAGAIPVAVGTATEIDETFKHEDNPPWIFAPTWQSAIEICKDEHSRPHLLQAAATTASRMVEGTHPKDT